MMLQIAADAWSVERASMPAHRIPLIMANLSVLSYVMQFLI
jgi:hypothetical protein